MSVKSVKIHCAQFLLSPIQIGDFLQRAAARAREKGSQGKITDFTATTVQPAPRRGRHSCRQMIELTRK
jgi:hypothetical protein